MVFRVDFGNPCNGLPVYQYLAMFTSTLTVLSSGMLYGWPSPTVLKLTSKDSPIPMTSSESSWIVVALLLGTFFGADIGALVLDKIGRKNAILLSSFPTFASWMVIAFARSIPELLGARILAGLSDGLVFCAVPMYLGEIANPNIRGFMGTYISISLLLGVLLMNIAGSYLSITSTAVVASTVPVLTLLTFYFMPESPYYLIMKNQHDRARTNLQILKGRMDVDSELERLVKAVEEQTASKKTWMDILTVRHHRKALWIGVGIRSAQQLSGMMVITFYAQTIFKEAKGSISFAVASFIYFGVYLAVTSVSSIAVDKIGRKPLMIFSIIGSGLVLLLVGVYFYIQNSTDIDTSNYTWVPVVALLVYVIIYSTGMQPVPSLLVGEVFPTNVKAIGLALSSNSYSITTLIVSKLFQVSKDELGIHVPFFMFSFLCLLVLFFIIFCVPETKGKTLEEIQEELKGNPVAVRTKEVPEKYCSIEEK